MKDKELQFMISEEDAKTKLCSYTGTNCVGSACMQWVNKGIVEEITSEFQRWFKEKSKYRLEAMRHIDGAQVWDPYAFRQVTREMQDRLAHLEAEWENKNPKPAKYPKGQGLPTGYCIRMIHES